jgi:hypothetical protein
MNNLMNSIFGRMFLTHPNHFINCGVKFNPNLYYEYFLLNKNIYGTFNFKKTNFSNNNWNITSNIVIVDEIKQIQYIEKYNFKKSDDNNIEDHLLGKMHIKNNNCTSFYQPYCNLIEFVKFNDIPNNIQQLIYSKTDNDIINCSCCDNHK